MSVEKKNWNKTYFLLVFVESHAGFVNPMISKNIQNRKFIISAFNESVLKVHFYYGLSQNYYQEEPIR